MHLVRRVLHLGPRVDKQYLTIRLSMVAAVVMVAAQTEHLALQTVAVELQQGRIQRRLQELTKRAQMVRVLLAVEVQAMEPAQQMVMVEPVHLHPSLDRHKH